MAAHRLGVFWLFGIAVMSTLAAVLCAGCNIDALAIAIRFGIFALCAAFAACADQPVSTFGTCGTAACFCILHAFASAGIDMKAVDALQQLACALCTSAILPACDGGGAGTAMQTAVVNVIELAGIFKDMHTF